MERKHYSFIGIFLLWYVSEIFFNTTLKSVFGIDISVLNSIISYLILVLLMLHIVFFQKYSLKEFILIGIITWIVSISTILSQTFFLMSLWMFVVASKDTSFEKIIQITYKVLKITVPAVLILHFLGYIEDYTIYRQGVARYSLGFSHPNQLGLRFFQLIVCHFYVHRNAIRKRDWLYLLATIIFVYIVPNSQTAFCCLIAFLIGMYLTYFLQQNSQRLLEIYGRVLMVLALLFNIFSVLFSIIIIKKDSWLYVLDSWMSVRFSACHKVYELFGVKFWGNKLYISANERMQIGYHENLWLDNAYMALLLRFGILTYVLFSLIYLINMSYHKRNKNMFLAVILFVYALYGIMEQGMISLTHNIFLLSLANLLYDKNSQGIGIGNKST